MEGSSPSIEEERTATFYVYHPCYFLQQALRALLKCVDDPITNSPTHKSSPDAADPPSTTNQTIIIASLMATRGSRGSKISDGSGPQHN
ncbi:hypothetical protein GLYMA_10G218900v4 [Glycine max]|nr:hypothetical protein GLYMA_10G218900v4 [Glycine max]KAH1139499.1 hypothetical protein GYH30_028750 [Glycine max]